jgi:hypothetical protein
VCSCAFCPQLNNSGGYFSVKERLKKAVVRIVRESFHRTDEAQLPQSAETDRFYAEVLHTHSIYLSIYLYLSLSLSLSLYLSLSIYWLNTHG